MKMLSAKELAQYKDNLKLTYSNAKAVIRGGDGSRYFS